MNIVIHQLHTHPVLIMTRALLHLHHLFHPSHHSPPLGTICLFSAVKSLFLGLSLPFFSPFAHLLFLKCYMSKIIWYFSFPDFAYHTTLGLQPGHCKWQDFIVLWLSNIPVCVCVCVCVCVRIYLYTHIHKYRTSSFTRLSMDTCAAYWK